MTHVDSRFTKITDEETQLSNLKQDASWSEIELDKLCEARFNKVTFNDPMFTNDDPPTATDWD